MDMASKMKKRKTTISLGPLGTVVGLELLPASSATPCCRYVGGLQYALPPTEEYRFRPPRPLPKRFSYGTKTNPGSYTGSTSVCPQPSTGSNNDMTAWDENCLQLNLWIPSGPAPDTGWPVFFYIHGGFLQWGDANTSPDVFATLLHETPFKAIIVQPAYRLNIFGFVASAELQREAQGNGETYGNYGFWDQRLALEWVARHIHVLDGDAKRITVGGYSAGSHSAFQQLVHDLNRPKGQQLIGRTIMWSNGPGIQAKSQLEAQLQFDELLGRLDISLSLDASEKLARLRAVPARKLAKAGDQMRISEFRAVSDGSFVDENTIQSINDGTFAQKCKKRGIKILNGECGEEWNIYAIWRPPKSGYADFARRLLADYPDRVVKAILPLYFQDERLPKRFKNWHDAWGRVYSDMQVYSLERGFAQKLDEHGFESGRDLLRYRIEWRPKCVDKVVPPEMGVTHGTDLNIWFWGAGNGDGLTESEKRIVSPLIKIFADFVAFKAVEWPDKGFRRVLRLDSSGKLGPWQDDLFEHGLKVWEAATTDQSAQSRL